jgi:hypothetical protein
MILSTWNWVTKESGIRPGEVALQEIIEDILKEMEEQMCLKDIPTVAPLSTGRLMMNVAWVWGCTCPFM